MEPGKSKSTSRAKLLPVRPAPQPGEIFVSWVARVAAANKADVNVLLSSRWYQEFPEPTWKQAKPPVWKFPSCPLFVEARPAEELMCEATGAAPAIVSQMLLTKSERLRCPSKGYTPSGIVRLPTGETGARQAGAWLPDTFCPQCLAEGFYLRRIWRVGFLCLCLVHHRPLIEFCPRCGSDLDFYRQIEQGRPLVGRPGTFLCHRCKGDLAAVQRSSRSSPETARFLDFNHFMIAILEQRVTGLRGSGCSKVTVGILELLEHINASEIGARFREPERPVDALRRFAKSKVLPHTRRPCGERLEMFRLACRAIECGKEGYSPRNHAIAALWDQLTPFRRKALERVAQRFFPDFRRSRRKIT